MGHIIFYGAHAGGTEAIAPTRVFHRNIMIKRDGQKRLSAFGLHFFDLPIGEDECDGRHARGAYSFRALPTSAVLRYPHGSTAIYTLALLRRHLRNRVVRFRAEVPWLDAWISLVSPEPTRSLRRDPAYFRTLREPIH